MSGSSPPTKQKVCLGTRQKAIIPLNPLDMDIGIWPQISSSTQPNASIGATYKDLVRSLKLFGDKRNALPRQVWLRGCFACHHVNDHVTRCFTDKCNFYVWIHMERVLFQPLSLASGKLKPNQHQTRNLAVQKRIRTTHQRLVAVALSERFVEWWRKELNIQRNKK